MIDDAALPGLRDLTPAHLSQLTGQPGTSLLRLRHREGKRAILHVASDAGEGVVWMFAGDKGCRVARRNPPARFDAASGAVFEPFPHDHRLPEIAALIAAWPGVAPRLIGAEAGTGLECLRYRPGLSCTFRTRRADRRTVYVKVIGDEDVTEIAAANSRVGAALAGARLGIAPVAGIVTELKAIAYDAAPGTPLDQILGRPDAMGDLRVALDAISAFHDMPMVSPRIKDVAHLRNAAGEAHKAIVTIFPSLAQAATAVLARLDALAPPGELRQIHGDMKLEHVFLDGPRATLIDTETMALGPVDYDLAMLAGRLAMALEDGTIASQVAEAARVEIAARAGAGFDWCGAVVGLRLAKFHAQHPEPGAEARAAALLRAVP